MKNLIITDLVFSPRLSEQLNIKLYFKRDDLFPFTGGGNKARKIHYILEEADRRNCNSLVTAGGVQSNHARVVALSAATRGWPCHIIIHNTDLSAPLPLTGNMLLMQLSGAHIQQVKNFEVADAMDKAMLFLQKQGLNPFYIWGGGHCVQGSLAYYEAVRELKSQLDSNEIPDYIIVASGTGTTQAGIEVGCRDFLPGCKVLGVSVARRHERGKKIILESIHELEDFLGKSRSKPDVFFDDQWVGEGYESTYPDLLGSIKWLAKTAGLILDPTYTGKAFYALINYIKIGFIPQGSRVVFWHTGGLLNLMTNPP